VSVADRFAPWDRDVLPEVETVKPGLNASVAQLAAWKGSVTLAVISAGLVKGAAEPLITEVRVNGSQLVGFSVNWERSM
jgi:hypothetical protein